MDLSSMSPAARWFRALRRTVSGENTTRRPSNSICEEILKKLRGAYSTGRTKPLEFRIAQLEAIVQMLENNENLFVEALENDSHRPKFETVLLEITTIKNEAIYAINNLEQWMQPEYIKKSMTSIFDECYVRRETVGVVLIIGGWTFPIHLCLVPLIGAIAAGNCVILKLSTISAHACELLQKLLSNYLDQECYHFIGEGLADLEEILENKFDHIFFTGDSITAKLIMQSACKYLTPVSLVLGGKNPCYVDKDCDIPMAARRIALARFMNAGQSSLAPMYVLCHGDVRDKLIQALHSSVQEFYGKDPHKSAHFGRLVNAEQYKHIKQLLTCGNVAFGGDTEETEKYIAPTVLIDVQETDPVMQQEILGPVLPVVTVPGLEEAIQFINRDRPLAIYVYSDNSQVIAEVMSRTSSGSFCSNDSAIQNMYLGLPCCGGGNCGSALYGGKYGFDTFSQGRAYVLRHSATECITRFRYPPYQDKHLNLMLWFNHLSNKKDGWCHVL